MNGNMIMSDEMERIRRGVFTVWHLPGGTIKSHEHFSKDNRSVGRDSNQKALENEGM